MRRTTDEMYGVEFTVQTQRDGKEWYIDYRGPNLDDAYAALGPARAYVYRGKSGYVSMNVSDDSVGMTTLVWEEYGTPPNEGGTG